MTMSRTLEFIADHLPHVTPADVGRFKKVVDIRDAPAFAAELEAFVQERLGALELPASLDRPFKTERVETTVLVQKAGLRAPRRWVPGETELQRGRAAMVDAFNRAENLPLAEFAQLAGKSRQQIYKDIDAGLLLALNVGARGQKLPEWQLDPAQKKLTQAVLAKAHGIDNWTLYRALSEPLEGLGGQSPVDAVTPDSIEAVIKAVYNVLGIH